MHRLRGVKFGDAVILVLLLAAGAGSLVADTWAFSPGDVAVIEVSGVPVRTVELQRPAVVPVDGAQGTVVLAVESGRIAVITSDCPNHVCVRTGWRSRAGDVIVCVPNRVIIRILGHRREGVRAVTG
jgi:hypothetical protein